MKNFTLFAAALAVASFGANAATVWEGEGDPDAWGNVIEIPASAFVNAVDGSKCTLNFTNVSTDPEAPGQVQLAVKTVADWTWTEFVKADDIVGNSYTFTILDECVGDADDTMLEMLQAHGLNVKGQGFILTSIELDAESGPVAPQGTTVWEGEGDPNGWNNVIEIPETAFAAAVDGSKCTLNFSNVSTDPDAPGQVQLAVKTVADWTWTEIVQSANIYGTSYTFTILDECVGDSDDTMLEMIKAHGLSVKGQGFILTSVTLSDGAGVGSISLDENAPAVYYNLQGARVDNPEKGIFIRVAGGKATKEIR